MKDALGWTEENVSIPRSSISANKSHRKHLQIDHIEEEEVRKEREGREEPSLFFTQAGGEMRLGGGGRSRAA